ncbi:hypothetical protein D3C85_1174160 [compost metagenome]
MNSNGIYHLEGRLAREHAIPGWIVCGLGALRRGKERERRCRIHPVAELSLTQSHSSQSFACAGLVLIRRWVSLASAQTTVRYQLQQRATSFSTWQTSRAVRETTREDVSQVGVRASATVSTNSHG